jgi:purine-nucleoside phosphorylase
MLYIVVALKAEAQAFIDKYKLTKTTLKTFTLYENKTIKMIQSGLGVDNATNATQTLLNHYDVVEDRDIFINVGVCASDERYTIGELIEISSINYKDKLYTLNQRNKELIKCIDTPSSDIKDKLVDMESFGFYEPLYYATAVKHKYIFKIVSDHFQPQKLTKEGVKSLLFNQIDAINLIIFPKDRC